MKVLLITHGKYLAADGVASGNSVRAYFLARGLVDAGIEVVHAYPSGLGAPTTPEPRPGIRVLVYDDEAGLASLIQEETPDALIVGYWELIEALPQDLDLPIVLDVVAPRILEAMYQEHLDLSSEVRRALACYRRADRFLVGSQRQASFLLSWLILAGAECLAESPIDVLPISVEPAAEAPPGDIQDDCLRLVSGGVFWPWRRTEDWFDSLIAALQRHGGGQAELALFSGGYVYAADAAAPTLSEREAAWPEQLVKRYGLLPYQEMQTFLRTRCRIGVELADENPERRHSQSFRAMEFLRNGLPLLCNGYTELAEQVRAYDAGWVVDGMDDLDAAVAEILGSPDLVAVKSRNALRLVEARFHYRKTTAPLVRFLREPRKAVWGEPLISLHPGSEATEPVATLPPAQESEAVAGGAEAPSGGRRAPRQVVAAVSGPLKTAIRQAGKPLLKGLARAAGRLGRSDAVIMVSRSDIRPANHGAAVKIDRTAWGLSHAVSAVYLVSDDRRHYWEVREGVFRQRSFPRWLARLGPEPERVRRFLIESGMPADDAFLYTPVADWSFLLRALYLALKSGARLYQAEFPAYGRATVWARDLLGGRALLVEHNVEYQRLADQVDDLPHHGYEMLRKVELGWCRRSDAVITVSEADRQRLVEDGVDSARVHVIPHGVDLEQFERAEPLDLHARYGIPRERSVLVYHGIYMYPPNLEAMQVMAREILPRLERAGVSATLLAIGAYPPEQSLHPNLVFTGPVESVAPYLKAADLAVVPLQKGGGTRMKILDYFAAGLAVVSTAKGAEGIPIQSGVQAMVVEGQDAFAEAVAALLRDPDARERLGRAARTFVEPLDWRAIAARYLELV
ncbi:glycosyltransferase [Thiorhodococcus minor]|uniref:Glycosyltransferase family 4 protein n=1 Tax=Thiorhodococcus minor TaxID=57489 RepID=A0A6M0K2K0_9GAMM|nr:glycosyltransferase [Thiorhodococcus minor]NEV62565.1 glycosyltransferase family 4 protein [Thiorhodococcus minor]